MKVECIRPVAISTDGVQVKHYKAGDILTLRQNLALSLVEAGYLKKIQEKLTKVKTGAPEMSILKKGTCS